MRISNPSMRAIANAMERDEVLRWSNSLQRARVTRWGGMISTPDEILQRMIKRTLTEMGCPPHILDDLMENCHERRWPPGLCSLETRQNNRRQYDYYVCKRVPGKQAVLLLSCDNSHMGEDMMVEPGLVMIFAHGIEWGKSEVRISIDTPHSFWSRAISTQNRIKKRWLRCQIVRSCVNYDLL